MLESGDDAAHGWRLDLLGGGEFAERFRVSDLWTAEDQHGECRQLRGADSGGCILVAHAAQQVDGGGMKAVRGGDGFGPGRDGSGLVFLRLDFCHRI